LNKIKKDAHNNKKECAFFMKKDKKEEKEKQVEEGIAEVGEDATKYGEFISSYFAWVSLPEQKEKVEKLEEITEKKNKTSKK
jgi:hypothetical protein